MLERAATRTGSGESSHKAKCDSIGLVTTTKYLFHRTISTPFLAVSLGSGAIFERKEGVQN
jgi:hypothetical protein